MTKFIGSTGLTYLWSKIKSALNTKQNTLVSGTNIKTINNESILGNGNITIQGGGGGDTNVIEVVKVNGTALTPDANKAVDVIVPTALSGLTDDTTHRLVTDTEKATWNAKGTYSKPSGGIPASDLASAVQISLGKADTALQSYESEFVYNLDASNLESTGRKTISSAEPYNAINAAYLAGKHVQVKVGNFDASMGMVDVFLPLITLRLAPYTFMLNLRTPYGSFYVGAEVYSNRVIIEFIPF